MDPAMGLLDESMHSGGSRETCSGQESVIGLI